MFRPSPARRIVAVALSCCLWLALVMPARMHSCPMHDGATAMHHGGAHHEMAHCGSTPDGGSTPTQCTCVGDCDAAAASAALPARSAVVPLPAVARAQRSPESIRLPRVQRADFALPFANGPPLGA